MEATAIPGTMSHYCYAAVGQVGKYLIRRFSCYCGFCARKMYDRCPFLNTIRTKHARLKPKGFTEAHKTWRTEGWAPYSMQLKEDTTRRETRKFSNEKREVFGKELTPGDVFGVYCGGSGEVTSKFFWLAEACPQSKQSNRVVFKAAKRDPVWDFNKGDNVLNIRWLERVDEQNRSRVFDPHGAEQTVPLKTTLPRKVPEWERTSTSRRVLTANDEDEYIEMCRAILEEKPTYSLLRHLQQKRTQGGASKAPAAAATAGPAVAAGPGVAAVRAHRHFTAPLPSPPAQGVRRGPRRAARRAGPGNNRQ